MPISRNLLVILTSGQRPDAFSHIGSWPLNTPQLDAIAKSGVALAAVTASPATAPGLTTLFTGLHPRQHGVLDDGLDTHAPIGGWVRQLIEAGYHAVGVGRIAPIAHQLHDSCIVADPGSLDPRGCSYLSAVEGRGILLRILRQREQRMKTGPFELDAPAIAPTDDIDGFIAQRARQMIERLPTDRPWVCIVSFTGPGNDLPAPSYYFNKVDSPKLTERFIPADLRKLDYYAETVYPRALTQRLNADAIAHIRRHYLARVTLIDHAIGVLRDAIDRNGHTPRTWISFTSDHGMMLGEKGLVGHRATLGAALYVPLYFLPPAGLPARDPARVPSNGLISSVDFVATLCAIAGVDAPRGCTGHSLLPAMHGEDVGGDCVISEYGTRLILETLQHRGVFDVETQKLRALFDLLKDPDERNDLADHPEAMNVSDMLRWTLANALMRLRPIRAA